MVNQVSLHTEPGIDNTWSDLTSGAIVEGARNIEIDHRGISHGLSHAEARSMGGSPGGHPGSLADHTWCHKIHGSDMSDAALNTSAHRAASSMLE